jgi:hypothetical protein
MNENNRDSVQDNKNNNNKDIEKWKEKLTHEQYQVCIRKGNRTAFVDLTILLLTGSW